MELFAVLVVLLALGAALVMMRRAGRGATWSPDRDGNQRMSMRPRFRSRPDRSVRSHRRPESSETLERH